MVGSGGIGPGTLAVCAHCHEPSLVDTVSGASVTLRKLRSEELAEHLLTPEYRNAMRWIKEVKEQNAQQRGNGA